MSIYQNNQSVIKTFNIGLLISMLLIFGLGALSLYSAARGPGYHSLIWQQLKYFGIGIVLFAPLVFVDSDLLEKTAWPFYLICLGLLIAVLLVGRVGNGSQRWLNFKIFQLQPSEIAKIAIVFALSKYFASTKSAPPYGFKDLVFPALLVSPLFVLILLQPDLGTGGILFLAAASVTLFVKVHWRTLLLVIIVGMITVPIAYKFVLKDYQRDRVLTFLEPERDPKAKGYNALQCKIAVGSGKIFGKGYLKGTQAQLNFIPEQHTDFIFSVFAEERGFLGCLILLILYGSYCGFAMRTVSRTRSKFEMLLAFGLTAILFWHVFINIGMVIGVFPIVGVTLPFFSYGGSSLLTFMLITALLLNLGRKRYIF